jgi:pyrimidine operon attenuation protein/uracil phosphoribosyltransferase
MDKVRSENAVDKAMAVLITQVSASYQKQPLVVGIHTGGAWVAKAICKVLDWGEPATLDISLYRDDFATTGLRCSGSTKGLPTMLNGEQILLVDDVLYTGRTIRAALNVLFDRGGRELPFEPKFLGEALGEDGHGRCKLIGPEPLVLVTPILE